VPRRLENKREVRVLLTTEGTYPYVSGGVSTWALSLIKGLAHHEFAVAAVIANPPGAMALALPPNAAVLPVPLWGLELVEEYLPRPKGLRRRRRTTASVVGKRFLPPFELFLDQILIATNDPAQVVEVLGALADFAFDYDLRSAMSDERVWVLLHQRLLANPLYCHSTLGTSLDLARSLYRYLLPLALPIPNVDVVHTSASAVCALPAIGAKLRYGTPMLLTEHGVYLRERILELVDYRVGTLEKVMFSNLYRAIAQAVYYLADQVAPVCQYNIRWERQLGLDLSKVRVIYNGVDSTRFTPAPAIGGRPTLVWLGRIQALKDVLTLIRAVAIVLRSVPDVICRVFGPDSDPGYAAECRRAVELARIGHAFQFEGPVDDSAAAFRLADVVVLSSMSEGFPFTVVEAMMCGRPVVATDVGGVAEALDDPTLLAEPQNATSLAEAIVRQLRRPAADRAELGRRLRQRAVEHFDERRFLANYDHLYRELGAAVV
jgi:polysaccharide biosynthesis protein PelF